MLLNAIIAHSALVGLYRVERPVAHYRMPCPYPTSPKQPYQTIEAKTFIAGFPYDATIDTDWPQTTPAVSILQLSFHPGVDVNDQSQPISTLWRNSLEYVLMIPGF